MREKKKKYKLWNPKTLKYETHKLTKIERYLLMKRGFKKEPKKLTVTKS